MPDAAEGDGAGQPDAAPGAPASDAQGAEEKEALPPAIADVELLSDGDFESFGARLRELVEGRDAAGLDRLLAAALWTHPATVRRRDQVMHELFTALVETLESTKSEELKDHLASFTRCLLSAALRMSLCPDMGLTRVHLGKPGAPCALILGFAGSRLEENRYQEEFYQSQGFSTVLSVLCIYPTRLAQRTYVRIARGLQQALDPKSPRLLLHANSGHGASLSENIAFLWTRQLPPFDSLPPMAECMSGVVWECFGPLLAADEEEQDYSHWHKLDATSTERLAEELQEQGQEGAHSVFVNTAINVLNKAAATSMPEWEGKSIQTKHKMMNHLLRSINPHYLPRVSTEAADYGASMRWWIGSPEWYRLECAMADAKRTPPHMFLYSEGDRLFDKLAVEAAVDRLWEALRGKKATILAERCTKAIHMELWQTEKAACVKAVQKFLKACKLNKI